MELKIKEEFKKLIPPLTAEEFKQLETNCIDEGIRDAIVTWQGFIIDGHNRYKIAIDWQLSFKTIEKSFDSEEAVKEWMIINQFGRRNLSNYDRAKLGLELEDIFSKKAKANKVLAAEKMNTFCQKSDKTLDLFEEQPIEKKPIEIKTIDTKKEVAKIANLSHDTIAKVKVIEQKAAPEVKEKLSTGEISINQAYLNVKKEEKKEEFIQKKHEQERLINEIENHPLKDIETKLEKGWYKVGKQFLYFGSNTDTEFKEFLPKAKFAFADPPYNAGVDDWDFNYKWELDYLQDLADIVAVTPGGWNAFNFYKETNMNYIWEMFCWISNGMTHGKCGYANVIKTSIFGNTKAKFSQDFWKINIKINETEDTKHKGRKPYEFMSHLLEIFSNENDTIIDAFAGSGTTMVLCEKMNRVSYNAELNKQYCIDIIKRIGTYERV